MGAIFRRNGFGKDPAFLTWAALKTLMTYDIPLYWLVHRDPCIGLLYAYKNACQNPHIIGACNPLYQTTNQGFEHCSHGSETEFAGKRWLWIYQRRSHCFCDIVLLEGWRILWWTTIKLTEYTFQPNTINITHYVKLEKTSFETSTASVRGGSCLSISECGVLPGRIHHWVTKSKSPLGWSWHKILHITWNQLRDWWIFGGTGGRPSSGSKFN